MAHAVAGELVGGLLGHQQHVAIGAEADLCRPGSAGGRQRLGAAREWLQGAIKVAEAGDVAGPVGVEHVDHTVVLGHADRLLAAGVGGRAQFKPAATNGEGGNAVAQRVDDEKKAAVATQRHCALVAQAPSGALALRAQACLEGE